MERYDRLYRLYEDFDATPLRELRNFVDLFPPVDSRTALDYWRDASDELAPRKDGVRLAFDAGEAFVEIAARRDPRPDVHCARPAR